jgi:exonuclease-1
MGITGLLPLLKDAIDQVHLSQLEGYVVAVDTYCWIYRGAFSVAEQLGLNQPTDG